MLYLWALRSYLTESDLEEPCCFRAAHLDWPWAPNSPQLSLIPISVGALGRRSVSRPTQRSTAPSCAKSEVEGPTSPRASFWRNLAALSLMTLVAAVIVWAIYFFPKDPLFYWKGIQAVNRDRGVQPYFYLMGTLKPGGWKSYLLVAWLVKTPIPSLLLVVAAVVMSVQRSAGHLA